MVRIKQTPAAERAATGYEVNRAIIEGIEPASLGLGLFYTFIALSRGHLHDQVFDSFIVFSNGAAAVIFLLLGVTVRRLRIPPAFAHWAVCALYGLALFTLLLLHRLLGESSTTSLFLVLFASSGGLVLSRLWFAVLLGMVAAAWGVVLHVTPPQETLGHLFAAAALAIALGFVVMRTRYSSLQFAERRRLREQNVLEASLASAESRLRMVADNAQDIIFFGRLLPEPGLEYVNPAVTAILGFTPEECFGDGKFVEHHVHPEDLDMLEANWTSPIPATKPLSLRCYNKARGIVWLELYSSPIVDAAGMVVAVEGIARDVTSRKLTEMALHESQSHLTAALTLAGRANERLEAEVAERRRIETDLTAAELKFRTLVEHSMLGICIVQNGRFQYNNPMLAQMFGYDGNELQGARVESLVYEVDREAFNFLMANTATHYTGELDYIFRGKHRDGRVLTLHARGTSIVYNGADSVIGSIHDVTERKQWEAKLRESKRVLATLISNLPGIAYRCANDERWTMEFISEGCMEITGHPPEDFLNQPEVVFADLIHPEDRNHVWSTVQNALQKNQPFRLLYRLRTRTGQEKWVSEQGRGVVASSGELIALEGFITDVTEQRRAELALAVSEERLRLALEATQVGIWDWNVANDRIQWSGGVVAIFGCELHELPVDFGRYIARLVPADRANMKSAIDHALASKSSFNTIYRIVRSDSTVRWIHSRGSVWAGDKGQPFRVIGNVIDITERVLHEEQLREAKDRAEESNRVKSVIFANMSHEIRTPMTAILGYSDLLTQRLKGTPMQRDVETIYQGGVRLLHLLNSIIDLARIEAGRTAMNPTYHPIHESVERVTGLLKVLADQKGIQIVQTVDRELMVYTDAHAEEQVLTNLLGNAIRFTERGVITISAERKAFGPSKIPMAVIAFEDTGIGISEQFLPHIFDEFRQESEGLGRQHEGSGLGLSITKKLVEKMTGHIELTSRKGVGTTVTVALPLAARVMSRSAEDRGSIPVESEVGPVIQRNILVVEDDPYCGQLLERMLSDNNTVVWCETVEQGLERAADARFDIVLMDINLKNGKLNGIQGLHALRKLQGYEHVSVIAVTAYAMKGDRERFLAEGFNGYIAKPFEPVTLRGVIDQVPSLLENAH